MIVLEFKARAKPAQTAAIDEAIRTTQFVRNKCLRYWMDNKSVGKYDLNKLCKQLAEEFPFAKKLNSMARQSAAERAWSAISRFYDNCKKKIKGKKGFPQFKKNVRSVEYKTTGWKLLGPKRIRFTDGFGIGELRLIGTYDLARYDEALIKRVRLVRRADGYYVQFCLQVEVKEQIEPSQNTIGLDVGIEHFYTDSKGHQEPNPRFYRESEKRQKRLQRQVSKKKKGSSNRRKARQRLAKLTLKISRRRKEHAKRLARSVVASNDVIAYEDLRIRNLVRNHHLAKSITDAGWYQFRVWVEYFAKKMGKITIAVEPAYTSQECSECGAIVQKSLSTRTHKCACGCELDRDHNAAINILKKGLATVGHTGSSLLGSENAWGDMASFQVDSGQIEKVTSKNQESPLL